MHIQDVPTSFGIKKSLWPFTRGVVLLITRNCIHEKEYEKLISLLTFLYLLSLRKVACTAKEIYHKK